MRTYIKGTDWNLWWKECQERQSYIIKRYQAGVSQAEIARELGEPDRRSVFNTIRRLRLQGKLLK